jgi:hypothetical protein
MTDYGPRNELDNALKTFPSALFRGLKAEID